MASDRVTGHPTDGELAALKAQHGEVWTITAGEDDELERVEFVVRRPPRTRLARVGHGLKLELRRQRRLRRKSEEAVKLAAWASLLRECVLHPSAAEFDAMLERQPGLYWTLVNAFFDLCWAK